VVTSAAMPTWHSYRVVVFSGSFDTHIKNGNDYNTLTLGEVFDADPARQDKANAPAMIPSSYNQFDARNHDTQRQRGSYVALAGDIDQGNVALDTLLALVRGFVGEAVASLIYSSSSAAADKRKWRIVIPLAQAQDFAAWQELQEAFFTFLEARGVAMDWALSRAGQLVYLPNVPTDKRDWRGAPLFYERNFTDGRGLTPADGAVATALADLSVLRARDEAERQQAKQAAKQAMQVRDTSTKSLVIDAFNQTYSIEMMLEASGYKRGPRDNWRSRYQTSTSFATRNFGDYWTSMSASDTSIGLGRPCAGGCWGDAFDLYCHFAHHGDFKKSVREAARSMGMNRPQPTPVDMSAIMAQAAGFTRPGAYTDYGADEQSNQWTPPEPHHQICLKNAIQFKDTPEAVNFVVDEFIQEGVVFIAGQQGVGKTSALLPLAMAQAGLHEHGYQFAPKKPDRWRHIIYLTEDAAQVNRVIAAMVVRGLFKLEQAQARIHVIPASAMKAEFFVKVRDDYTALFSNESGVQLPPLVVVDTRSACFVVDSENDNAEMSKLVSELKQNFAGLPIWVIAHLAKDTATRSNAATLSVRGAGSAEGDAHQVLFLVKEHDNSRWLVRGKTRFESPWQELNLRSEVVSVQARDRWDEFVSMNVRWSVAEAPAEGRAELLERAKIQAEKEDQAELRDEIRNIVQVAWNLKHPLNKQGVKGKVKRKAATVIAAIDTLLAEGWLYEVSVPSKDRTHSNRSAFLVNLTTEQHESFLVDGSLPDELMIIPKSWRKKSISDDSDVVVENTVP
jgi:AAA domain